VKVSCGTRHEPEEPLPATGVRNFMQTAMYIASAMILLTLMGGVSLLALVFYNNRKG
jgi:hypothetical protein